MADIDALIVDVLTKHETWMKNCPSIYGIHTEKDYRDAAADAAPTLALELKRCREALKPFAAMDRPDCILAEIACERGTGYDKTILTSADFRIADNVLKPKEQLHEKA